MHLGVRPENILMTDSKGVIYEGRTEGMNKYKARFARKTEARTLDDAMKGADAFVGVASAGLVTKRRWSRAWRPTRSSSRWRIPTPRSRPRRSPRCAATRSWRRVARTIPNQVNNVLGFPFIFRGALDVRARKINLEMKLAAVKALAELARMGEQGLPEEVRHAYPGERFEFGPTYIIPKPFDPRVLIYESMAVAKAAMDSGVARAADRPRRVPRAARAVPGQLARVRCAR